MNIGDGEELFLRSLDTELSTEDQSKLNTALDQNPDLKNKSLQLIALRKLLVRKEPDTFGPFFAERIAHRISQLKSEFDYQILFFFKKYQLIAAGIIIALLTINILVSDQLSVKSILGFEEEAIEDVMAIDVYSNLMK